jgi:error-prone DNA polymerase
MSAQAYLRQLCEAQLSRRYPKTLARATEWLEKELRIIAELGLANYFLIVWDIVQFCKQRGILCHGRGSAANSIVAYLLGVSAVDPITQGLVVERFISVEHGGTPDIDLDIDAARRETVIQYVYSRWGRDHAAMACTYVTYRTASAIRDAGFALGFRPHVIEEIAQALEDQRHAEQPDEDGRVNVPDIPVTDIAAKAQLPHSRLATDEWQRLVSLAERLRRRPRHLGLHNGGMIVTGEPIAQLVPVEPAAMDAVNARRTVVQFDKEGLEQLGIVKIDLLGLRMLSAIADAVSLVQQKRAIPVNLYALDFRDPAVYQQICSTDTIGIFQVESGAQVSVIPDLQPQCYQDLVIEVSLIRPGPLQGNMVRPYLRRRKGLEPVTYPHASLKAALQDTLGVIIFQEQVIKVACDFAGFTPGRGELLRRALGSKDAPEALESFRVEFLRGAIGRGVEPEIARQVWQMIRGFAGYSFSKAHAAAFAVIVYWSAWLRVHYPVEYFCGLLRNAPLGTYPAHVLESEARRRGVKFLPFDINCSQVKPDVDGNAIRHGLGYVKGIGAERAETIVQARGRKPFKSLADFIRRTGLERRAVEALILSGAFDALGERRQLLWDLAEAFEIVRRPQATLPLLNSPDERAVMPPMMPEEKLVRTFATTGVTAGPHLVALRRDRFTKAGCVPYQDLLKMRDGTGVKVGGLVADGLRRPPTANGMSFMRLEDPDGLLDVIISPPVYAACHEALRSFAFLVVEGVLQKNGPALSVVAQRVTPLAE